MEFRKSARKNKGIIAILFLGGICNKADGKRRMAKDGLNSCSVSVPFAFHRMHEEKKRIHVIKLFFFFSHSAASAVYNVRIRIYIS